MIPAARMFVASLAEIRWFQNSGKPLQAEGVVRLASFAEWPGPEDPRVKSYVGSQQALKDELESLPGSDCSEFIELWNTILWQVVEAAGQVTGYDPTADAWHAPTTAVRHAGWTAGIVAWCKAVELPMPDWLAQQWEWFAAGRWPAGFASIERLPEVLSAWDVVSLLSAQT